MFTERRSRSKKPWFLLCLGVLAIGAGAAGFLYWDGKIPMMGNAPAVNETSDGFTIAVFGDNEGVGPVLDAIIEDVNKQDVDFIIQTGDATSHGEAEEFTAVRDAYQRFDAPVYPVVGNNDIIGDKERTQWMETFGKERWYAVEHKGTQFLFLDNADRKVGFPEEERVWLQEKLAAPAQHRVLVYHRPFALPLENIFGDDETGASRISNTAFRELLTPETVDHIYTGHVHTYIPYTLDGVPVSVTGGGGALPQAILGGASTAFFHYLLVHITPEGITHELVPVHANSV